MEYRNPTVPPWLRILQWPLARLVVLGGILFYMMMMAESNLARFKSDPPLSIAAAIAMGLLATAVYVGYGRLIERRTVSELSLPGSVRECAAGALLGAGLYTACVLILMILGVYRVDGLNAWTFLIPGIAMALKAGIFEELVFRGVLFRSVEDMFGSWISIVVSSLVFGLLHLFNPEGTIAGGVFISIEAGLLLAAAYLATRRLWICFGFHAAWNYVQSAVYSGVVSGSVNEPGLIRDTIQGPDLLTGGSFGMEQSVIALVLCTTAGIILLIIAARRGHIVPAPWKRQV
ncbi:MAG: CPBP family intramembrane glutamic endopeptidase [Hyphomicrobiales bacterium]